MRLPPGSVAATCAALCIAAGAQEERRNRFDDPFLQVTAALAECPQQEGPKITLAEMQAEAHWRAERGTSCYQSGRCRLPNAYLYDKEIIPRVAKAIVADGRYADTSLWVEGQRRWVWLKGCVRRPEQAASLEQLVRGIDDVEAVINQLVVVPSP
ncbi:BON domain-containing protein [Methylibium sp.]|uniref:BON domain-containing protein n=1 Tax=Methylibium sp. TaxID=2067992 RepID=UPI003D0FA1D5